MRQKTRRAAAFATSWLAAPAGTNSGICLPAAEHEGAVCREPDGRARTTFRRSIDRALHRICVVVVTVAARAEIVDRERLTLIGCCRVDEQQGGQQQKARSARICHGTRYHQ